MDKQHPITPPPELVSEWVGEYLKSGELGTSPVFIATRAAQYGADQELEACCEVIEKHKWFGNSFYRITELRAARRPKPPSLKQQALAQLDAIQLDLNNSDIFGANTDTIRRALEQLDD
jgi:hypothetical protein